MHGMTCDRGGALTEKKWAEPATPVDVPDGRAVRWPHKVEPE